MKISKVLLLTLAMMIGLPLLAIGLRGPYARWAASHFRSQLPSVADDRVDFLLTQIAQLEEPGIPVLVEALGSQRECVARGARQTLDAQLQRWQMPLAQRVPTKLAILADSLAERVDQFGPTARRDAAELATIILQWRVNSSAVDNVAMIAACEKVLRRTTFGGSHRAAIVEDEGSMPSVEQLPGENDDLDSVPWREDNSRDGPLGFGHLGQPGGGLPIASFPNTGETSSVANDESSRLPKRLLQPATARPLNTIERPNSVPMIDSEQRLLQPERRISERQGDRASPIRPLAADETIGQPEADAEMAAATTIDVMYRLHSDSPAAVERAKRELQRRGFSSLHLELARRLTHPANDVRRELVRALPGLQSVDATPWLLWLAQDGDREVRRQAISLLATATDPRLLQKVVELADQDTDPRIREQGRQLSTNLQRLMQR